MAVHQPCDKITELDKEVALLRDRQGADRARTIFIERQIDDKIFPEIRSNKTAIALIQLKLMIFTTLGGAIGAAIIQTIISYFRK